MAITNDDIRATRLAYVDDAEHAILMLRTEVANDSFPLFCSADAVLSVLNALRHAIYDHHDPKVNK